ncbi:MAG: dTDP-4-dehydrorhamnose 3,5-epimerase [Erysipelotrichaceae bacterium]
MKINKLNIEGLLLIENFNMSDDRGSFEKVFIQQDVYEDKVMSEVFVTTSKKNVIRGLHFQTNHPQDKYISVLQGEILDVAVDLRKDSPTFGTFETIVLNEKDGLTFVIPAGFAHGFQVLSEKAMVLYCCVNDYDKNSDTGIVYNDETLSIPWKKMEEEVCVSLKDQQLQTFNEFIEKNK